MDLKNLSNKNVDDAKIKFDKKRNPQEFEDGMDDDTDDVLAELLGGGTDSSKGDDILSSLGLNSGGGGLGPNPLMGPSPLMGPLGSPFGQPQQQQKKDFDEELWEGTKKFAKGFVEFIKDFVRTYVGLLYQDKASYVSRVMIVFAALTGLVLFLRILGVKLALLSVSNIIAALGINMVVCVVSLLYLAKKIAQNPNETKGNLGMGMPSGLGGFPSSLESDFSGDDSEDTMDTGDDVDEDYFDFSEYENDTGPVFSQPVISTNNNLDVVSKLELFEAKTKSISENRATILSYYLDMLPFITPEFTQVKPISEHDDLFFNLDSRCTKAINAAFSKQVEDGDNTTLYRAEESAFMYRLFMTRIKGFNNTVAIQKELEVYLSDSPDERAKVLVDIWQEYYDIKVFKDTAKIMIGLRDIFDNEEIRNYLTDTKQVIPSIVGVTDTGKVIKDDLKEHESMLIAGMPRFGKTWFIEMLFYTSAMFVSPRDLQFIIIDPKAEISDWKQYTIPHVVKFEDGKVRDQIDYGKILRLLRKLVNEEGKRRKKIIGEHGCVKIWDLKKKYPDIEMPIIYVIIDEVISISNGLGDAKKEFDRYIQDLISQLPAVGIRTVLIPHLAKHQFLDKSIKQLITFKASVGGDADHIKSTLEYQGTFGKDLTNKGDIALKLGNVQPMYIKAPVVGRDPEELSNLCDFNSRVWNKIGYKIELSRTMQAIKEGDYS